MTVIGIPTTRVSDMFVRSRLEQQISSDQLAIFRIQQQLSTGHRFSKPSEEPEAASRVISLQQLVERKTQVQANLTTNMSFLDATDTALSTISGAVAEMRGVVLGVIGTVATEPQREAAAIQIAQAVSQLKDIGNQTFRGRYLFAGSQTGVQPFTTSSQDIIEYVGNENLLMSFGDIDLQFATNVTGADVFGAISTEIKGSADLDPVMNYNTRLASLQGGNGITKGSISITYQQEVSIIDLSGASTIGQVARLIRENPPTGVELNVEVSYNSLKIDVASPAGGKVSIREVAGGTTAAELGIYRPSASASISGDDLDPTLSLTTSTADILGTRAREILRSTTPDTDIIFEAQSNGASNDGMTVDVVNDAVAVPPGTPPICAWDPIGRTLTVTVNTATTTAAEVITVVNAFNQAGSAPITAMLDPTDDQAGGQGLMSSGSVTLTGGDGENLDFSGLVIENGRRKYDGVDYPLLDFSEVKTIEDLLNTFNLSSAGLLASINADASGINVRSRLSGDDFSIGENGGTMAQQLGLRTFTRETVLTTLNDGYGIDAYEAGDDFTITLTDGTELAVNVSQPHIETVGDVIDEINLLSQAAIGQDIASLKTVGNGIEIVDPTVPAGATGSFTITRDTHSFAAWGLGLIPRNEDSFTVTDGTAASITITSTGEGNDLIVTTPDGAQYNGVQVSLLTSDAPAAVLSELGIAPGTQCVYFDAAARTLSFYNLTATTTANDVMALFAASSYPADGWSIALEPTDVRNSGAGDIADTTGTPGVLTVPAAAPLPSTTITFPGLNNDLLVTAKNTNPPGPIQTGCEVAFDSSGVPGSPVTFAYNPVGGSGLGQLTITYDGAAAPPVTANDVLAAYAALDPLADAIIVDNFDVSIEPTDGDANTGEGVIEAQTTVATTTGGTSVLSGIDTNPVVTRGIFTALMQLQIALEDNDLELMERAIELLDGSSNELSYRRAELGAEQQTMELLSTRLDLENVELRSTLAIEYDVDMAAAVSNYHGRQAAYEASLRTTANISRMSLLSYL